MDVNWTLLLPREAESVGKARRMLRDTASLAGVDPEVSFDLGVALTEACANVIEHAGPADGYWVAAGISSERCWIDVIDNGSGFAPHRLVDRDRRLGGVASRGLPPEVVAEAAVSPRSPVMVVRGAVSNAPSAVGPRSAPFTVSDTAMPDAVRSDTSMSDAAVSDAAVSETAESGRGLLLIEALCDRVDIRNHPARGAMIHFERDLAPIAPAAA